MMDQAGDEEKTFAERLKVGVGPIKTGI